MKITIRKNLRHFHDCTFLASWPPKKFLISLPSATFYSKLSAHAHTTHLSKNVGEAPVPHICLAFRTTGPVWLPVCKERCWFLSLCEWSMIVRQRLCPVIITMACEQLGITYTPAVCNGPAQIGGGRVHCGFM